MKSADSTAVKFDPNPLQVAESPIYTPPIAANEGIVLPRTSRCINFVDDGKLFEGHFTLHTRGLKSLIQNLVDQQSEQRVIINDLQDQVNTLRQQASKMRKLATASPIRASNGSIDGSGTYLKELEDLRRRVKQLEGFRALWGVRPEEVENLISTYGEPVVTPEEYTACILNLQPFRLMRTETRNSIIARVDRRPSSPGLNSVTEERGGRTRNTRDRNKRDDDSRTSRQRNIREDDSPLNHDRNKRDDDSRTSRQRNIREDDSPLNRDRNKRDDAESTRDDDTQGARDRNTRDESRNTRDNSRNTRDESRNTRDNSRNARDDSQNIRDSRNARDDSQNIRESRNTRDDSQNIRDSRNTRDDSQNIRDSRNTRDDSQNIRDSRNTRESRNAREENRLIPERDADTLAQLTSRLDALERKVARGSFAGPPAARRGSTTQRQSTSSPMEMVDEQAREDIEELERFVTRRLKDIDKELSKVRNTTSSVNASSAASNAFTKGGSHHIGRPDKSPVKRSLSPVETNTTNTNESPKSITEIKPRVERKSPKDSLLIDQAAREDAAAALEQIEQLEKLVNRKLKEFSLAIGRGMGNIPLRPSGESEIPFPNERKSKEPLIDQMARDDAARALEVVQDLEEDLGKRWQSLEERLRIIGRATMNKGSISSANNNSSSIDRKAREDASMSLMRIQQLEREIVGFRRILQKHKIFMSPEEAGLSDTRGSSGIVFPAPLKSQRLITPVPMGNIGENMVNNINDPEYQTRMQNLEQEVEQRMEEVNRALATLRTTRPDSELGIISGIQNNMGDNISVAPSQVIINSRENNDIEFISKEINSFLPNSTSQNAVLVMTSRDMANQSPLKLLEPTQGNSTLLRPPQMGEFGAPLVTREALIGKDVILPGLITKTSPVFNQGEEISHKSPDPTGGGRRGDGDVELWQNDDAVRHVSNKRTGRESPSADAAIGSAAVEIKLLNNNNNKISLGDARRLPSRDRTVELNQLRSHSMRLRDMTMNAQRKRENEFSVEPSALGHTTPCVVYNCAWCAAQKRTMAAKTARS